MPVQEGIPIISVPLFLFWCPGAGCVVFTTHSSFIAAVSSRFMQLSRAGIEKKVISVVTIVYCSSSSYCVLCFDATMCKPVCQNLILNKHLVRSWIPH